MDDKLPMHLNGLCDVIYYNNDVSSDDDITARTEELLYNPTPINWKTKDISTINSADEVSSFKSLPHSDLYNSNVNNNEFKCPDCNSKCQINLIKWCLSCGRFLDKPNKSAMKNDVIVNGANNVYHLDLTSLNTPHGDDLHSTLKFDIDLNHSVRINGFNSHICSPNSPIIPPLDLSSVHTNENDDKPVIPKQDIDEKENVRRWNSSSLAWKDMPVEMLRKKPANHIRVKLNSFTNHHAPIEVCSSVNEVENEIARSTPNYPVAQYLIPTLNHQWQYLPTEIWLRIMSYLTHPSLSNLQQTCQRMYEIGMDPQFWRCISLNKHHKLTNKFLLTIADHQPTELNFMNCIGTNLTVSGLSEMLTRVGKKLTKLSFVSCSKGAFESDNFLKLSTQFCPHISHINASYLMNMDDQTLIMMSEGYHRISSVSLMGSCSITNLGIKAIINKHFESINHIDFYGCFKVNNETLKLLERCENLESIALGSITKLGRTNLIKLLSKLPKLQNLDLRGTLNLVDDSLLSQICDCCPGLRSLILTNSARLSSHGLIRLADSSVCGTLKLLDVSGCSNINDKALIYLLDKCRILRDLDISCTSITNRGFKSFQGLQPPCLKVLRVNNNRLLTSRELSIIVNSCKKLECVYLCGFTSIKNWNHFKRTYPNITFNHD